MPVFFFFFSSRRRHTRSLRDWSSDVCSSDLHERQQRRGRRGDQRGVLGGDRDPGPDSDRKSTRLNSSHVEISYAVFCLKKKKIMDDTYISDFMIDTGKSAYGH